MDTGAVNIFSLKECLEIVKNALKLADTETIELKSYSVKRGSDELVGFMGEYYKLKICLTNEQTLNFFVKSVPLSNEYHKDECERKGFFRKETRLYAEILPNIQRYASSKLYPECYYIRADLVVLEDLSNSPEGLRHLSDNESYTLSHHKVMLRHLARLHAASIAWERDEHINIGEKFKQVLVEIHLTMSNDWYASGIKGVMFLCKRYEKFQNNPQIKQFIDEKLYTILCNAESLTNPSATLCNVLCHRDSWDRNIFYKFNDQGKPIDCRIVDFQLTRYSPPAMDVLFYLYINTPPAIQKFIYEDCLEYYYETLMAFFKDLKIPENLFTKTDFEEDCRRARLAVLILWANCEPLVRMPKGIANKMRAEEQEKFDHYMNHCRDELFLRIIAIDADYERNIMAPIEELIDYCLQNKDLY